ncbi:MAG: enoyl-CoA hydratase-related protein [Micromonosporaceae bacterium]
MSKADDTVLVERDAGVAVVTLNRPGKLNALTPEMQHRYVGVLHDLDGDPGVRAIVVTGAGRGFCSGADLAGLADNDRLRSYAPDPSLLPTVAHEVRKPMVAAVNGPVAGIGFALMLACDVRFVGASVRMSTTFSRLGLVAEYGLSWLLPRVVGTGRAIELLMSGRAIGAEEAVRIGLAHECVVDDAAAAAGERPVLGRALEWARDVAVHCSPRSLANIKRQVYGDHDRTREESIARALSLMVESFGWGGLQEALAARQEKRDPVFPGLGAGE